jgi:UPF0755 protein
MRGDIVPPKRPNTRPFAPNPRPDKTSDVVNQAPASPISTETPTTTQLPRIDSPSVPPESSEESLGKKRGGNKRQLLLIIAGIVGILIAAAISGFIWYSYELTAVQPGSTEKVRVTIERGSSPMAIAATLKKSHLIRSEAAFGWYIRVQKQAGHLQSGVYRLSKSDDVATIVGHLTSGNADTFSITFYPGATLAKHRQVLIKAGYSAAKVDAALNKTYNRPLFASKPAGTDLEGYIYGETYNFPADATPEQILERTFDQFESVVKKENLVALYQAHGFSLYQGITLASIIQREVASPADAAQVSQVFQLRLSRGIQLGSDVTYQYIADKTGQPRNVNIDSPYNTRRYTGLPPGPISSPGLAALKAVGSPAPGDYLYFLSGDDDKTYFAHTNEEHEQNVKEHCQKKCQII